ncbi:MAG: glycerol-3-phosphate responsive antiterminator [Oscillospiraceae bacterium]|jgi:glycerol uptake operon antiterminator|nr:glycerol-3-phosphate responsive antiterminator [Oscillospiraceae bacterium]
MSSLYDLLTDNPVIAAVKEQNSLDDAIKSECGLIFLLTGNISIIDEMVNAVQSAGKQVYIHMDLMEGFGRDKYAMRYIKERVAPNGIISTRSPLIKTARDLGITAIQRIFLIDNLSIDSGIQSVTQVRPDAIEIMPGIMPKITKRICAAVKVPVIAGGLINEKDDIIACLNAGAVGISTSNKNLWNI